MSKPNRYREERGAPKEAPRKGHIGMALLILLLLAGVVAWFWLARDPALRSEFLRRFNEYERSAAALFQGCLTGNPNRPYPR